MNWVNSLSSLRRFTAALVAAAMVIGVSSGHLAHVASAATGVTPCHKMQDDRSAADDCVKFCESAEVSDIGSPMVAPFSTFTCDAKVAWVLVSGPVQPGDAAVQRDGPPPPEPLTVNRRLLI